MAEKSSDLHECKKAHQSDTSNDETTKAIERNKFLYQLVNGWIGNADNKVSIFCGVFTVIFGILTFLSDQIKTDKHFVNCPDCCLLFHNLFFFVSLAFFLVAIFFYTEAIAPNLNSSGSSKSDKQFPIFYGDISSLSEKEYETLMKNAKDQDFNDELVREVHINSVICMKKMKAYRYGIRCSSVAIISAVLSLVFCF